MASVLAYLLILCVHRGGKGVKALRVGSTNGGLVAIKEVSKGDELMVMTKNGTTIRTSVDDIRVIGRVTQGVRIIKLSKDNDISAVAKIPVLDEQQGISFS